MSKQGRVVLIYKRTHTGDPSPSGIFGIHDCMGIIRDRHFTDVIGIGGKSPDKGSEDIAYKINWIGTGAKKVELVENRGAEVIFDHFCLFEEIFEFCVDKSCLFLLISFSFFVILSASLLI